MKYMLPIIFAASAFSVQAKEIRLKDCPAVVKKTINSNLEGGRIDEIDRVLIKGKTRYIVDIDGLGGRDVTLRIGPGGSLLRTTKDVNYNECPKVVRNAIENLLDSGWQVDDIDRIVKKGVVTFSVEIDRNNAPDLKVVISAKGKVIKKTVEKFDAA